MVHLRTLHACGVVNISFDSSVGNGLIRHWHSDLRRIGWVPTTCGSGGQSGSLVLGYFASHRDCSGWLNRRLVYREVLNKEQRILVSVVPGLSRGLVHPQE